jgi:DNA-directed RNA polymerase subunit D
MEDPNIFDFTLNINTALANSLRRIMISKIPSIVINNVCIKENDSSLDDEMIAHRLGQIPLKKIDMSDITEYNVELDISGPITVYSRDLTLSSGIIVVDPDIILIKLKNDERLKLFGNTGEGIGEEHSKFNVCCGTTYKKISENMHHFHVESTGVYTSKEIFNKALIILKEELLKYRK